jgi:hypothetical protein
VTALSKAELEAMAQEATVDCYDKSEQVSGFYKEDGAIVAICVRGGFSQAIRVLDLPLPTPPPAGVRGVDRCLPSLAGLSPVGKTQKAVSPQAQAWVDARKRHHLSHMHVQTDPRARAEPEKAQQDRQSSAGAVKAPLPQFIEHLYLKRFGRERPLPSGSPSLTARPTPSALPGTAGDRSLQRDGTGTGTGKPEVNDHGQLHG